MGQAINGVTAPPDIFALKTAVCLISISLFISSVALLILIVFHCKLIVSANRVNAREISSPK